ncbi:MAG TPA: DUF3017 domain-containing protein [Segeticoccus sp.]|uniref:DUF3017 domain-containing protein n=1 Tax=Segeticoccus sp. TaxID=2706531 RepID=UPI002D7FD400|nr:DUF3017 domain-containing protein [Segeticoccus sp.]HET8598690.1 DUF3017 domain-containing protein [Segeticoccus sp.]
MIGPRASALRLWWVLGLGFAAGLAIIALGALRLGGFVMAGSFALAGILRLVLPRSVVGALVVRSRGYDVVALWGLALALVIVVTNVELSPR